MAGDSQPSWMGHLCQEGMWALFKEQWGAVDGFKAVVMQPAFVLEGCL